MAEGIQAELRIRVTKRHDAGDAELCADLPHLHSSHWEVTGWQPGNPGSSALGSFTIPLFPPGTEQYDGAKPYYDALNRFQRVEAYSGGRLMFTGLITGIRKTFGLGAVFELTGVSDIGLANLSRPFPGEVLSNDVTSAILKSYLGTNELGAADTFNPFTSANYVSTHTQAGTSGTWSSTTDDGFTVVSTSTGTGAVLLSKTGAAANDRWHTHFVEVTGRLSPSNDTANAGIVGVGLSNSAANINDGAYGYVEAAKVGSRWNLNATVVGAVGGVESTLPQINNALLNVDDPQGMIPLTVGILITMGGGSSSTGTISLIVNGKVVLSRVSLAAYDPGTTTRYPYLVFGAAFTGTATCYLMNLVQMTRFTTDGPSTAAVFGNGTISVATHSLAYGNDPGPTFLEAWSRLATREGWYWRYTPSAYTVGTRTLGTVDFEADPGTDYGTNQTIVFSESLGNLVSLELNDNADPFATDTAVTGQSTLDGGGIGYWRDIANMTANGVIQDEVLSFTHSDFNTQRRSAFQISSNKTTTNTPTAPAGSKTAVVLRDPQTADKFRELDKVMIHCPSLGVNYQVARVVGYTWDENSPRMTLLLDQFSADQL